MGHKIATLMLFVGITEEDIIRDMDSVTALAVHNPQVHFVKRGTAVSPFITIFLYASIADIIVCVIFRTLWPMLLVVGLGVWLMIIFVKILNSDKDSWKLYPEETAVTLQKQSLTLGSQGNPLDNVEEGELATQPVTAKISARAKVIKK